MAYLIDILVPPKQRTEHERDRDRPYHHQRRRHRLQPESALVCAQPPGDDCVALQADGCQGPDGAQAAENAHRAVETATYDTK